MSIVFSQRELERARTEHLPAINQSIKNIFLNESELIEYIETIIETNQIPGLATSIVKNGDVVWNYYFGYSNLEEGILVNENTMFSLASVSKTVTVTALMQLWEQGAFNLDDDIDIYLPFNVNHPDYAFNPITFRMLLTHTSGIKDRWSVMPYYDGDPELELGYFLEQYLTYNGEFYNANQCFTNAAPGSNYVYSNIGVALIGYLVEVISETPFNEYCNENIFQPLGMGNASWFLYEIEELDNIAFPYVFSGGDGNTCYDIGCGIYDESNPCFCDSECIYYSDCCSDYEDVCGEDGTGSAEGAITLTPVNHYGYADYPSGQLRSSSSDLAKFMAAYINYGEYNGIRVLETETVELIKTIQNPSLDSQQALIWYYKNQDNRLLFGHNGGDIGSLTELFISVADDIGVIVLCNTSNYSAIIDIENALFDFAEETMFSQLGDINQDSFINIQDIILLINIVLDNGYNNLADINSDNIINIQDIVLAVNLILNN